ncbi:MAG: 3-dehydroquinate synthase [Pseudomonadota bacterium]
MRRPLLLNGFMATGKTSVGRAVAERLRRPFIDLDARIEQRAGCPIAEIFARSGEAAFRALEREALREILEASPAPAPVVSLGGGALLRREQRLFALDRAVVVTLDASLGECVRRARASNTERPLLAGNAEERAADLLEARRLAYAECHARIPTDGRSIEDLASAVAAIWQRDPLAVAAGERSYSVEIGRNILGARLAELVGTPPRLVLVTDETVHGLHGAAVVRALSPLQPIVVALPPGEEHKHIGSVERIWRAALEGGADRGARVVGFGGGVVTDIAGFAAATYQRGVAWVGVPTTLLAMVDASTGGKTGVDLAQAKNAVGAFWQPSGVLCDVELLTTESPRGFRSALAEVVKTALIGDPELLDLLEADAPTIAAGVSDRTVELVHRSIRVKARIVSADEREAGARALLNLGHTVGHALEACAGYTRLTHGEAVSLGLVAALRIGARRGLTPPALAERVERLLARLGLPVNVAAEPLDDAARLLGHDKKRAGKKLRFVVARAPGSVETTELSLDELAAETRALAAS